MINLITKIIIKHIRGWFLVHTIINLIINSMILPVLNSSSVISITHGNITYGIMILVCYLLITIVTNFHDQFYLKYHKTEFRGKAHLELFERINSKLIHAEWHRLRLLDRDDLEIKRTNAINAALFFIQPLVSCVIDMFPFFGYTIWLFYHSPPSVILYVIVMTALIVWLPHVARTYKVYQEMYDRLHALYNDQFRSIIHHKGIENHTDVMQCITDIKNQRHNIMTADNTRSEYLKCAFNIMYCINLMLFASQLTDIATVILYTQYTNIISGHILTFSFLYVQYQDSTMDFYVMEDLLKTCGQRESVPQLADFNEISISDLSFIYPANADNQHPFAIKLASTITMKRGDIIKVDGNSGHGKSTFFDIICGIISRNNYNAIIMYDGKISTYGFDAITSKRCYVEQFESTKWNTSVCEIITGNITGKYTKLLDQALAMAQCTDFIGTDKQSIYSKEIKLSGGQKARVQIARTIYNILITHPAMIVLDEIDKAIQGMTAKLIMDSLFDYCRCHRIICLVSAHSQETKDLSYDNIIKVNNGLITI